MPLYQFTQEFVGGLTFKAHYSGCKAAGAHFTVHSAKKMLDRVFSLRQEDLS